MGVYSKKVKHVKVKEIICDYLPLMERLATRRNVWKALGSRFPSFGPRSACGCQIGLIDFSAGSDGAMRQLHLARECANLCVLELQRAFFPPLLCVFVCVCAFSLVVSVLTSHVDLSVHSRT